MLWKLESRKTQPSSRSEQTRISDGIRVPKPWNLLAGPVRISVAVEAKDNELVAEQVYSSTPAGIVTSVRVLFTRGFPSDWH
jgi:hypothetical protein